MHHWHPLHPGRSFFGTVLILTFLFRVWVAVIIMAFAATRYGVSEQLIAAGAISFLAVTLDFFFTARQFIGWDTNPALCFTTYAFKSTLITVCVVYAAAIWYSRGVWQYTAFGLFVAAIFAFDFFLLRFHAKKPA